MRDGHDGTLLKVPFASWLVPFLLLFVRERDSYGRELTRRVASLDSGVTRPGMVYRALRQMENEGVVRSEHDGLDRRLPRRKYSITVLGEAHLELWANSLTECQKEADLFFGACADESARRVRDLRGAAPVSARASRR